MLESKVHKVGRYLCACQAAGRVGLFATFSTTRQHLQSILLVIPMVCSETDHYALWLIMMSKEEEFYVQEMCL